MGALVAGVTFSNSMPAASTTVRSCRVVPAKFNVTVGLERQTEWSKLRCLLLGGRRA